MHVFVDFIVFVIVFTFSEFIGVSVIIMALGGVGAIYWSQLAGSRIRIWVSQLCATMKLSTALGLNKKFGCLTPACTIINR
jgi:hypothetical protein